MLSKPGKQKRRYNHKDESCSDRESDLELSKELLSIGGYITSSEKMVDQMFRSISIKKLRAMLPEILKVNKAAFCTDG
jgi:Caspase activity and apoptosis inhibitor 1